ncbi:MAG: Uncharacterized protein Athens101428_533 [Candidatus Berkelbacteria bacterium Athens1014_28]|uniref:Uncharacterized protein n=1 Tax=Candidatus Berkelbacteria bacterium Athens1014_28 TaxID=2017145 RepID=A0A554LLP1_9BACT|nr:MAG: Uncharacterized protein Athens101428_533 [Candidatus Berkelbacteria bacterium Athens1014_28]
MNKKNILLATFSLILFSPIKSFALCPVCTVAIAGGLGLSRWLKVDDTISGIWIGALIASSIFWAINVLNKRRIYFFARDFIISFLSYAVILLPLYYGDIIGHPLNVIWGLDKLIVGIIFGSIIFILSVGVYIWLKKNNDNHPHFAFEKIIIPLSSLTVASLIFFLITKK